MFSVTSNTCGAEALRARASVVDVAHLSNLPLCRAARTPASAGFWGAYAPPVRPSVLAVRGVAGEARMFSASVDALVESGLVAQPSHLLRADQDQRPAETRAEDGPWMRSRRMNPASARRRRSAQVAMTGSPFGCGTVRWCACSLVSAATRAGYRRKTPLRRLAWVPAAASQVLGRASSPLLYSASSRLPTAFFGTRRDVERLTSLVLPSLS